MLIHHHLEKILRPKGKIAFLRMLKSNVKLLDVGCGNNSPFKTKQILPKCEYVGIDIGDYNQAKPNIADQYILTTPNQFAATIHQFANQCDAVISAHNLEHCDDRDATLNAMLSSLKINGCLYLSFPCKESVLFPKRYGTLNYYDDCTHQLTPPNFEDIINVLQKNGFEILYAIKNYRPLLLRIIGFLIEPFSSRKKKAMRGTWEYYGFESIIWARKTSV
jgi:SAM-dependent methyltransferase